MTGSSAFQNNIGPSLQRCQNNLATSFSSVTDDNEVADRRSFLSTIATTVGATFLLSSPLVANAGIDPTLLKSLPVQGDESGTAQRLRQIEAIQRPTTDTVDVPFEELPSGVSYREYREGKGEAVVQKGSKVAAEMTIRCKSFSTQNEPGGLKYFSTKDDTEFNEIAWTVGSGEILPGLEEAMMGMHRYVSLAKVIFQFCQPCLHKTFFAILVQKRRSEN